jgi:hypothetical protein
MDPADRLIPAIASSQGGAVGSEPTKRATDVSPWVKRSATPGRLSGHPDRPIPGLRSKTRSTLG